MKSPSASCQQTGKKTRNEGALARSVRHVPTVRDGMAAAGKQDVQVPTSCVLSSREYHLPRLGTEDRGSCASHVGLQGGPGQACRGRDERPQQPEPLAATWPAGGAPGKRGLGKKVWGEWGPPL